MRGVNDLFIEGWPCDRLSFTHDMCSRTQDQRNAFFWRNVWQSSLLAHERKAQQRAHQGKEVDELFLRRTEVRLTRRFRVPQYTQGLEGSCSGAQLTGESVSSDVVNYCSYNGCELSGGNYWNPVASSHNSSRYVNCVVMSFSETEATKRVLEKTLPSFISLFQWCNFLSS